MKPKTIALSLLLGCFLLVFSCSTNRATLAGKINGTNITYSEYMDSFRGHYNNFQVLNNRAPDNTEKEQIKRQTWLDATKHVILKDLFTKYKITATLQETLDTLRLNIPDYLLKSPLFVKNGVFDRSSYLQSLEFDTPENLQPVRKQYQEYFIPIMKLKEALIDNELLTAKEKKLASRILQSKADIDWIVLDSQAIDPLLTEEEIRHQYELNQSQYRLESFYSLAYFRIPVTFSKTDMRISNVLADSLYQELMLGDPISEVIARRKSYFPQLSYKNSGLIGNNDLDPALYSMFTKMEEGSYNFPIADKEGLTIYQLEKRTKSMSSFNTLRIPYIPSETSIAFSRSEAENVQKLISAIGLEAASSELELNYSQTGRLKPLESWIDDSVVVNSILDQLPGKKPGYVFPPLYCSDLRSWLVVQVKENQLDKYKPLSEVRDAITRELSAVKRGEMVKYQAERIISNGSDLPSTARIVPVKGMTAQTPLLDRNVDTIFYQALRAHQTKAKQQYHTLDNYILIPQVQTVSRNKKIKVPAADIRRMFVANLPPDWFDTWLNERMKKAVLRIFTP